MLGLNAVLVVLATAVLVTIASGGNAWGFIVAYWAVNVAKCIAAMVKEGAR